MEYFAGLDVSMAETHAPEVVLGGSKPRASLRSVLCVANDFSA
jgi:hypothetical protein